MRDEIETLEAEALLRWYDQYARTLPWRISPADRAAGVRPDPYCVWMSEVMLQQTTVAAVKEYFHRFTTRWPTVESLAAAEDADVMAAWAGLGYYARARNLLACARAVVAQGGFPTDRAGLQKLPGIGAYTSAAIAAIVWDQPETVVDGNVERVVARLLAVTDPTPKSKPKLARLAEQFTPQLRAGDFAQAMMDLGATVCTPRNPRCDDCPLAGFCAGFRQGIAATLPAKSPKAAKPTRMGIAYVALRADGAPLLETRPPKGLLGGTRGWPGSDWSEAPTPAPPLPADWAHLPGTVKHTFTHFHLELTVAITRATDDTVPLAGEFVPDFDPSDLPTVMRKVWYHAATGDLFAEQTLG